MRLKKGDEVEVIAGNDLGLRGEVLRVLPRERKVIVSGVRMVTKHQKTRQSRTGAPIQGGIINFEAPIDVSNVMLICPHTGELTRVGFRREIIEEGERKARRIRFSKKSGQDID